MTPYTSNRSHLARLPVPGGVCTVFEDLWFVDGARRVRGGDRTLGLRQDHAAEHPRRARRPDTGVIIVDGKVDRGPSLDRAVIFQSHALLPWKSALGNVAYAVSLALAEVVACRGQGQGRGGHPPRRPRGGARTASRRSFPAA